MRGGRGGGGLGTQRSVSLSLPPGSQLEIPLDRGFWQEEDRGAALTVCQDRERALAAKNHLHKKTFFKTGKQGEIGE